MGVVKEFECDIILTDKRVRETITIKGESIGRASVELFYKYNDPYYGFLGYKEK